MTQGSRSPRARRPVTFFRSRWVDAPIHGGELPDAELPAGFRAAGVAAGIKPDGLDVGVLVSDSPATVSAARFTTNARVGAPVIVSRQAELTALRAVAVNSGCSNVGDGQRGLDTAEAMQASAADKLGLEPARVGVASTGVIGMELPRANVVGGIEAACDELGLRADTFSEAILTSDSAPKRACLQVNLSGGAVRLAAQAKGAGMISPRFATMFCFIQTDALLEQEILELLTGVCVKRSFDRISVDGQLSTSDTVIAMANGHSGVKVESESQNELRLGEALDALLRQLALDIVADGEGARRVGRVVVQGDPDAVEPVARAVANSPLVKTALHGGDPNFGRILQAAGQAWPAGEPFIADLEIEGRLVVSAGEAVVEAAELPALAELVQRDEVEYAITLPGEGGETELFFSDLSSGYVDYNASYTS
jgi:glutamate N-acetyltransferase / amino-acid N-acetyltransferase